MDTANGLAESFDLRVELFSRGVLTSSMCHPAYVSSKIDSVNSGSIALCRSVRKSVLI